jgi:Domain of Unknown Function (DUF748)
MRLLRYVVLGIIGLIAAVVLVLALAPDQVARFAAGRAAAWAGVDATGLDTLNVSLRKGTVSGGPVTFGGGEGAEPGRVGRFEADVDTGRLLRGEVMVRNVAVADADLAISTEADGSTRLNGIRLGPDAAEKDEKTETPPAEPKPGASGEHKRPFAIQQASLDNVRVQINRHDRPSLPVAIERLRIADLSAETPDTPAKVELAGRVGPIPLDYTGEVKAFTDPIKLDLDGSFKDVRLADIEKFTGPLGVERLAGTVSAKARHKVTLANDGNVAVTTVGNLSADGIDIALPGQNAVRLDRGRFTFDSQATVTPDGRAEVSNRGPLAVEGLNVAWSEKGSVKADSARVDVHAVARLGADKSLSSHLKGGMPLTGLVVAWSQKGSVWLDDGTAGVDIDIDMTPGGKMTIKGPMTLEGGAGGVRSGESFKLSYKGIDADYPDAKVEVEPDGTAIVDGKPKATMEGFALDAPVAIGATRAVATSKSVHVVAPLETVLVDYAGTLDMTEARVPVADTKALRMKTADIDVAKLRYDEAASMAAELRTDIGLRALNIDMQAEKPKAFPVSDAAVTLAGLALDLTPNAGVKMFALDPKSQVVLEGTARGRPHQFKLGVERLRIADLDPDVPEQTTTVDARALINATGAVELREKVKPFVKPAEFTFDGSIDALELPALSPYVAAATGLNVESGRLSADGTATAANGKLDGVVNLDIQTLGVKAASDGGGDPMADLTGLPIDLAISLLEDSNRRIQVKLPFSGDLSDPEVDYCDVIRTALLGAVRLVVTAPIRGIASAVEGDSSLKPVEFEPGQTAVTAEGERHIAHVARLLTNRRVTLQVCGRATKADQLALGAAGGGGTSSAVGSALSSRLLALARDRTRVTIERLIAAGVPPGQVQECRPSVDVNDAGPPRADTRF